MSAQGLPPGLSIIHSNRMEDLRQVAVQWIARHPLKPLENELFIVQSNGMAQWLKLALAADSGCGISAALDFQLPARFLWRVYRAYLDPDNIPQESPFDEERLVWRLLRLLPTVLQEPSFAPLKSYLTDDRDQRKRYQLARCLADLYDQYQVYRADWLADWESGSAQLRTATSDLIPLPSAQTWQAKLWRHIRSDIPAPQRNTSRAHLHRWFLKTATTTQKRPSDLPRRVLVFGISSMPRQSLEALHAISKHSQVLMFVHNPCRHYWADIIEDRDLLRIEHARHKQKPDGSRDMKPELLHQQANPLLAAWAKQGRDYIGLLYGYDQPEKYRQNFEAIDLFGDLTPAKQPPSLLQQVQQAILDLTPLPKSDAIKQPVSSSDHSISFQLAHSRQREVEILHDQLLLLFDQTPGLRPQDIIVMTPDIDTYVPHIEAVFGLLRPHDPRHIPFTVADRPQKASIPILHALEKLLNLPTTRMTVSDMIDLLEVPSFRARFGLTQTDLPRLQRWIEGAGIRWGLNAEHRSDFDLPTGIEQNTWLFGLKRMLLGYAVGSGDPWRQIEPYSEIGGLEAALVGPLADILDRLEHYRQVLAQPASATAWGERILSLTTDFFAPQTPQDQLTQNRFQEVLENWLNACTDAQLQEPLTLPVVREALLNAVKEASMSQRFLAGMVNFCTLMPMRAIPFKVVCLLGMNDGEYPRSIPPLDFDLMFAPGCYRPGDRSRREDDRYLFLEALLSARNKFYISYIGRSAQDNSQRMPSVLVGQLRDYLANGWTTKHSETITAGSLLDQLTCQHPLQPFSKNYYRKNRPEHLFTYAQEWRRVFDQPAKQALGVKLNAPEFTDTLQLDQLIRFLKNPIKTFFNQRLNVYFEDIEPTAQDLEPFELDSIDQFNLTLDLLNAGLAAVPAQSDTAVHQAAQRLRHSGDLPPGGLGDLSLATLVEPALGILGQHHTLCRLWSETTETVEIVFPAQIAGNPAATLEDWLDGLRRQNCEPPVSHGPIKYARWEFYPLEILDPKGRIKRQHALIGLWIKHLAGCAHGLDLTSHLLAPDGRVDLLPVDEKNAANWLHSIVAHWWAGLQQPLPVTAKTALAYLTTLRAGDQDTQPEKAIQAARIAYQGDGYMSRGELGYGSGPYLKRTYPDFDALWQADNHKFRTLTKMLYAPILDALAKGAQT